MTLFSELSKLTQAEIEYYYEKRRASRRLSKVCRGLAWMLGTVGLLIPLIHPILDGAVQLNFLSWGYAAFGLAGAMLLADTVFAGTRAHHRYTSTQIQIEHTYSAFALRWHRALITYDNIPDIENAHALIDEARAFCEAFHHALEKETVDWKKDVEEGLSQLKSKISLGKDGA